MSDKKNVSNMPEFLRKLVVSLKRRPQIIAMIAFIAAFLIYSLNLTYVSHTTARIQGPNMGLLGFVTMLLSMLFFVCFLNAFPRRKKPNVAMLVLMLVMIVIIIFSDVQYSRLIHEALTRDENPIAAEDYILRAQSMLRTHIITLVIGTALVALLPVYSRILRGIKTSVEVQDNGKLAAIDIEE